MRLSDFRPVGNDGENYPDWVRDLATSSGVYAIRDRYTGQVLYVGESHTGNLYRTLTRHLQAWSSEDSDRSFNSYHRDAVEVAVLRINNPADVPAAQSRIIADLEPRDNIYNLELWDEDDEEEVPF